MDQLNIFINDAEVFTHGGKKETYEQFLDKFKVKHTTDECYTPPAVYDVIKEWVVNRYKIDPNKIKRPFKPNGDYEKDALDYDKEDVVLDNPPFSMLADIVCYYTEHGVKFFLYGPHLQIVRKATYDKGAYILVGASIVYDNGAKVPTSFITNLEPSDVQIVTAPQLCAAIKEVNDPKKSLPINEYLKNVFYVGGAANLLKEENEPIIIKRSECQHIRNIEECKDNKKEIYGSGFLISDSVAERIQKEAERAKQIRINNGNVKKWNLTDKEQKIVKALNEGKRYIEPLPLLQGVKNDN